jgi:hypothetical protein
MEKEIKININNPKQLELLYRENTTAFANAFNSIYVDIKDLPTAQAWNERLNFKEEDFRWGKANEILFIIIAALVSGLIAKMPSFLGIEFDTYLSKNVGFVIFPMLSIYFAWKQSLPIVKYILPILIFITAAIFINYLPNNDKSATLILSAFHLPILLWTVLGYMFTGGDLKNISKQISFLQFNGNFIVMTALIFAAGMLFSGITIALFELLGLNIAQAYFEQIAIWGFAALPILSTFLIQNNPQLVNKISPIIARIFTPLVLVTLFLFLCTLLYTQKNIYTDRDFLLLFNILLIAVMAIILFSLTTTVHQGVSKIQLVMLFSLSLLTIIANGIAVYAILIRLNEFGFSPNRIAVIGANSLMFIHLLLVSVGLFKNLNGKAGITSIERAIAKFIPIYAIWAVFIIFIMPFIFNFS